MYYYVDGRQTFYPKRFRIAASDGKACSLQLGTFCRKHVVGEIPIIDLFGKDAGRLLESLAGCGVVCVQLPTGSGARAVVPAYGLWAGLHQEARYARKDFYLRPCVARHMLRFSEKEDLKRTVDGDTKDHTPDRRSMLGVSDSALRTKRSDWGDVGWIIDSYRELREVVVQLLERELTPLCVNEGGAPNTLGAKLRSRREAWGQSALRHCVYTDGGICTEHTDYGVATLQHSNAPGLEALMDGKWRSVPQADGCCVIYAGDMLERLTNGLVRALMHRVCLPSDFSDCTTGLASVRQSHVFFLQPDFDSVVRPLQPFVLGGTAADMPPVKYGDWHRRKVALAFGQLPQQEACTEDPFMA